MTPQLDGWVYTVGWALVHFIWQGAAIALATAAVLGASRRRSPEVRYGIACCGLVAMLAAPVATAAVLRSPTVLPQVIEAVTPVDADVEAPSGRIARSGEPERLRRTAMRTTAAVESFLPMVVSAWLCGVALLLAEFAGASWRVRQLRLSSLEAPPSQWQSAGDRLAARLGLRQAFRIVDSALVTVPSVIGVVRPVVLLPLAALTRLSPDQIEALVVHELAHIRRRDYFVNIAQTVVETLLFFHPAVWWLSARIRQEREHCCDDIAVQACGEPVVYASALAELAAWRTREPALSLGAADGALLARVRRILNAGEPSAPRAAGASIAMVLALIATAGLAAHATARRTPPPQAAPGERVVTVKTRNLTEEFGLRTTDHFQLFYQRELDLHADRVAREAEAAYARVSDDLRHNLANRIPFFVVRSAAEVERIGSTLEASSSGVVDQPAGDHILLAVDQPADQWLGIITHEIAHVFGFDILPSKSVAPWIREGLAEYERGSWDPNDLALLRQAVRSNAVPAMSRLQGDGGRPVRLVSALGHAAFDFIESRAGKPGVRQFLFALRKTADTGADPFLAVLQAGRDAFDRQFEAYLRGRFATVANQAPRGRADLLASLRVEGEVTAIHKAAAAGLACIELWVPVGDGIRRQRWAVECPANAGDDVLDALKPGDRVVVTGPLAHGITDQRVTLEVLMRPADGFTWPARQPRPIPAASPRH